MQDGNNTWGRNDTQRGLTGHTRRGISHGAEAASAIPQKKTKMIACLFTRFNGRKIKKLGLTHLLINQQHSQIHLKSLPLICSVSMDAK